MEYFTQKRKQDNWFDGNKNVKFSIQTTRWNCNEGFVYTRDTQSWHIEYEHETSVAFCKKKKNEELQITRIVKNDQENENDLFFSIVHLKNGSIRRRRRRTIHTQTQCPVVPSNRKWMAKRRHFISHLSARDEITNWLYYIVHTHAGDNKKDVKQHRYSMGLSSTSSLPFGILYIRTAVDCHIECHLFYAHRLNAITTSVIIISYTFIHSRNIYSKWQNSNFHLIVIACWRWAPFCFHLLHPNMDDREPISIQTENIMSLCFEANKIESFCGCVSGRTSEKLKSPNDPKWPNNQITRVWCGMVYIIKVCLLVYVCLSIATLHFRKPIQPIQCRMKTKVNGTKVWMRFRNIPRAKKQTDGNNSNNNGIVVSICFVW